MAGISSRERQRGLVAFFNAIAKVAPQIATDLETRVFEGVQVLYEKLPESVEPETATASHPVLLVPADLLSWSRVSSSARRESESKGISQCVIVGCGAIAPNA